MELEYTCPISKWGREELSAESCFIKNVRNKTVLSYFEADRKIENITDWLIKNSIKRATILSRNTQEFILFVFAALRAGVTLAPLNVRLVEDNWKEQIKLINPDTLFIGEGFKQLLNLSLNQIQLSDIPLNNNPNTCNSEKNYTIRGELPSTVIFTSGTTGAGKGVLLTAQNHFESALASNEVTGLSLGDSWLLSLPMFHVGGHEILFRAACAGASVIVTDGVLSGEEFLSLAEEYKPSHLSLVPTVLEEFVSTKRGLNVIKQCKTILLGGAPSSQSLRELIVSEQLPVLPSYGMTETCSHCTCVRKGDGAEKLFTSGCVLPHTRIRIINPEGMDCEIGAAGEIALSGKTIHQGIFTEEGYKERKDEWFFTGDLGILDTDGYLSVIGRKDEMFISGGENIYPAEIENAARKFPGVKDCAVLVVDSQKWGKRPVLYVESETATESQIRNHLGLSISKFKVPEQIYTLGRLPRKGIGKIDRELLFKEYQDVIA